MQTFPIFGALGLNHGAHASVKTLVATVRNWLDAHDNVTLIRVVLMAATESHYRALLHCMHQYFPVKAVAVEANEDTLSDDDSEFVATVMHTVTVADGVYNY